MVQGLVKKSKPAGNPSSSKRYVLPQRFHGFFFFFFFHASPNIIAIASKEEVTNNQCNCRPAALGPKPGPRQIAPKKNSLVKQRKMTKVRLPPSSLLHPFLSGIYTQRETCG